MTLYLDEFLWRGRPPDDPEPPAYHVCLGSVSTDAFGRRAVAVSDAMTPDQAAAMGFGLPDAIAAINAALMAENAALQAARDDLAATLATMRSDLATLSTEVQRLQAALIEATKAVPTPATALNTA